MNAIRSAVLAMPVLLTLGLAIPSTALACRIQWGEGEAIYTIDNSSSTCQEYSGGAFMFTWDNVNPNDMIGMIESNPDLQIDGVGAAPAPAEAGAETCRTQYSGKVTESAHCSSVCEFVAAHEGCAYQALTAESDCFCQPR